jgi:Tfp pilus assembly protein PilZ
LKQVRHAVVIEVDGDGDGDGESVLILGTKDANTMHATMVMSVGNIKYFVISLCVYVFGDIVMILDIMSSGYATPWAANAE